LRKRPLVSTVTQMYHGREVKVKAKAASKRRRSHRIRNFRDQSRNRHVTARGKTRPTGPLVNTASPDVTAQSTNQVGLFRVKPSQKRARVNNVKLLSRASGLAK